MIGRGWLYLRCSIAGQPSCIEKLRSAIMAEVAATNTGRRRTAEYTPSGRQVIGRRLDVAERGMRRLIRSDPPRRVEARQGRDVHVRRTRQARAAGSENPTGQRKAVCGGGTARARLPFVDQLPAMFMTRTRDV